MYKNEDIARFRWLFESREGIKLLEYGSVFACILAQQPITEKEWEENDPKPDWLIRRARSFIDSRMHKQ